MAKIAINSFLKVNGKSYPVKEYNGKLTSRVYIYGWIEVRIGDSLVVGKEYTDLIDQLWVYILNGLTQIKHGARKWHSYFPDQPLEVIIEVRSGLDIQVSIGSSSFIVEKNVLFHEAAREAKMFFGKMRDLIPEDAESWNHFIRQASDLSRSLDVNDEDGEQTISRTSI